MIAVVDYEAGNLRSVVRALEHLGLECCITSDADRILSAERVIFPGVGAAGRAMETIVTKGLDQVLREVVDRGTPFFGICLGTQVIMDSSDEDKARCLGLVPGTVRRFGTMPGYKIPHMGWNNVQTTRKHPVMEGVMPGEMFYFVHSYYPDPSSPGDIVGRTSYGIDFASVISRGNIFATQFHPEKSGVSGLKLLKNFSVWDGKP